MIHAQSVQAFSQLAVCPFQLLSILDVFLIETPEAGGSVKGIPQGLGIEWLQQHIDGAAAETIGHVRRGRICQDRDYGNAKILATLVKFQTDFGYFSADGNMQKQQCGKKIRDLRNRQDCVISSDNLPPLCAEFG
ncbi:MAG: hypothetical protein ACSLE5_01860 [Porticoccaceae bacterium]